MCYDNATTDCNGTAVLNVTTARECCLGDNGFWFDDEDGQCHQCIGTQMLVSTNHLEMYSLLHCLCGNSLCSTYRQSIWQLHKQRLFHSYGWFISALVCCFMDKADLDSVKPHGTAALSSFVHVFIRTQNTTSLFINPMFQHTCHACNMKTAYFLERTLSIDFSSSAKVVDLANHLCFNMHSTSVLLVWVSN